MPNIDSQVLAQMLRSKAGAAVTPAEMARMQQNPMMNQQSGAALTPYEQQQLALQQAQFSGR